MRGWLHRSWTARVAGLPLADVLLSVVLSVLAAGGALLGLPDEGPVVLTLPVALASTAALAVRTRSPALAAAVALGAGLVQSVLSQPPGSIWSLVVLVLDMYALAAGYREGVAAALGAGFVGVLLLDERFSASPDYLFVAVVFGGTWVLGRASRRWRGRVSAAEREREHQAALAVAEERLRIARELHDIVGHALGLITVQAEAAAAALEHDPVLAREPVRTIADTSRRSLHEIRGVLHLIRHDAAPAQGIEAIRDLTTSARGVGLELDLPADSGDVPAVVQLAAYRIVQESLTNAARHAPGAPVRVRVARVGDGLDVEVCNGRGRTVPSARGGVGLVGIRERAVALGGRFDAGPSGDGFAVRVRLPLTAGEGR